MMLNSRIFPITVGAAVLACSRAAHATTISYTASGTQGGDPLSARADFTTGAGFIDVTLTNTLAPSAIVGAGSELSDVRFTLSNAPGAQGNLSATGQLGDIAGTTPSVVTFTTGSPVRFIGKGPPLPGGTGTFTVTGNTILMEAIGGGKPSQMILPAVPNGGTDPNSNASVANFIPSTIGPGMFALDFAGVTADTTITVATFSFGTGPDHTLVGAPVTPPPVSEPASLTLLGSALVVLGLYHRRRRKSVRAHNSSGTRPSGRVPLHRVFPGSDEGVNKISFPALGQTPPCCRRRQSIPRSDKRSQN